MEKETLYKFFDGKASREEKEAVRIWLESSPENEQELFKEREFFDAMILSGSTKVAGMEKKSRPFYRTVLLEAIKIAAVFAITVASGTYFYKSEICKIGEAMNTITVPAGQRANLTLADGTNVWLNARSEMRYPAVFTGNKREITLDGEAYFEVSKNTNKPFFVIAEDVQVKVYGTTFNINTLLGNQIQTTLVKGSVGIRVQDSSQEYILKPSQQAIVQKTDGNITIRDVDTTPYTAWTEGIFLFDNERLETILDKLALWYDVELFYQNESVKNVCFTGYLKRYDNIDVILNAIESTVSATFHIKERTIIINKNEYTNR